MNDPKSADASTPSSKSSEPRQASTEPTSPAQQTQELADAQRQANSDSPRNYKDDAVTDKVVHVEPDGTGPTPTDSFDPEEDRAAGSGNAAR